MTMGPPNNLRQPTVLLLRSRGVSFPSLTADPGYEERYPFHLCSSCEPFQKVRVECRRERQHFLLYFLEIAGAGGQREAGLP